MINSLPSKLMWYSPSLNIFFRNPVSTLPDLIEIKEDYFRALLDEVSTTLNGTWGPGENGYPIVVIREPIIQESKCTPKEDAAKLLAETDQFVLHALETGEGIPSDLREARENARKILSEGLL